MQKIIPAYASSFTQKQITLWFCLVSLLGIPSTGQADIYRFVTIDGIESFTDAPLLKEAKVLIKDTAKSSRKGSAKALSKESIRKSAPSLQEIIEKTVQAQLPRQTSRQSSPETILPVGGRITSGVGMRIDPLDGSWRQHNGIDIAVPEGTPVKAVSDGTVLYADLRSGYGWTVLLEHDSGMITLYAHNSRINVAVGQSIKKNDTISLAGNTGRSTGPHVHFEAWQAGTNVTPAFMPNSDVKLAALPGYHRTRASFHKVVLADGSLLITNLPNAIP
jgi:murein DD-endopeptidase MepM/ murein hydrolase activator NlpD